METASVNAVASRASKIAVPRLFSPNAYDDKCSLFGAALPQRTPATGHTLGLVNSVVSVE